MPPMRQLLQDLRRREGEMVRLLGALVKAESPSFDKVAVDRCGRLVAAEWKRRGARVRVVRQKERGDQLRGELWLGEGKPKRQILLLGHVDTVYPLGTLKRMPFRVKGGKAYGPGAFDMKGGLVLALFAVDAIRRAGGKPKKRIVFLWTSDEEIGSDSSRTFIEAEAKKSDAVLVLEPAAGTDGKLKTARKGVGEVELLVTGKAAHAGLNPEAGVNAVHELALQIAKVMEFGDAARGITVNAGVMSGGTRTNVIAEQARALVDLRIARLADQRELEAKFAALQPILPGAKLDVRGGINRPPLERTEAVAALFGRAQELAGEMGMTLGEASVGGGSDGNFTGALGIPTLDGLGAVGDGAHSTNEHILVRALPERAALLAGLLTTI